MFALKQKLALKNNVEVPKSLVSTKETLQADNYHWIKGMLSPALPASWYENLKAQLNKYAVDELIGDVRKHSGYTLSDLKKHVGAELSEMKLSGGEADLRRRYIMLENGLLSQLHADSQDAQAISWLKTELALTLLHLNYGKAPLRKSGNSRISHQLRAGLFASIIGGDTDLILTCLLHDMTEEHLEGKISFFHPSGAMDGVTPSGQMGDVKYDSAEGIFRYLGWLFGKEVDANLRLLTRDVKMMDAPGWDAEYQDYLQGIYTRIGSAFAKGIDAIINLWELDPILDQKERAEMIHNTILKASWQARDWQKISWRMHDILASAIEEYAMGEKYAELRMGLRAVYWEDLFSFHQGFAIAKKLEYSPEMLAKTRASGIPVLGIFDYGVKKGRRKLVIEFPFIPQHAVATEILAETLKELGMSALKVKGGRSLLPKNLSRASFLRVELDEKQLRKLGGKKIDGLEAFCRSLVPHYDSVLVKSGAMPKLDRGRMTGEARYGPYFSSGDYSETPLPENEAFRELKERLGLVHDKYLKPSIRPGTKRKASDFSKKHLE